MLQSTTFVAISRQQGGLFQNCTETLIPNDYLFTLGVMVLTMTAGRLPIHP